MIVVDYSATAKAVSYVAINEFQEVTEDILRHLILNSIRNINNKFSKRFGQIVIAIDSRHYWREEVFPYYKWKRKENRKNEVTDIDWNMIYTAINKVKDELREFFPYIIIESHGAEADDVIGVLAKNLHLQEKIIIISRDGDFKQLQQFKNVYQYDMINDKPIKVENPRLYLSEHIIRGDSGDGICNIMSPNDSFYTGTRQKACGPKKIVNWIGEDPKTFCTTPEMLTRYEENEKLIDLTNCPVDIANDIIKQYNAGTTVDGKNIHKYMMTHKLVNLLDVYEDFKLYGT